MFFFRFTAGWSDQPIRPALLFCVLEIVRDRIRILWEKPPGQSHNLISGCCAVGSAPALGAGGPGFESPHSDHFLQKNRLFRRFFCVFSSVFAVWITAIQRWFKGQKSGVSMSEDSRRNRQIPNPSLIGVTAVFSLWIRQILEFSSLIHYNSSTVSLCATKAAVWVYSHAAF